MNINNLFKVSGKTAVVKGMEMDVNNYMPNIALKQVK
jgi:hypothetical protein